MNIRKSGSETSHQDGLGTLKLKNNKTSDKEIIFPPSDASQGQKTVHVTISEEFAHHQNRKRSKSPHKKGSKRSKSPQKKQFKSPRSDKFKLFKTPRKEHWRSSSKHRKCRRYSEEEISPSESKSQCRSCKRTFSYDHNTASMLPLNFEKQPSGNLYRPLELALKPLKPSVDKPPVEEPYAKPSNEAEKFATVQKPSVQPSNEDVDSVLPSYSQSIKYDRSFSDQQPALPTQTKTRKNKRKKPISRPEIDELALATTEDTESPRSSFEKRLEKKRLKAIKKEMERTSGWSATEEEPTRDEDSIRPYSPAIIKRAHKYDNSAASVNEEVLPNQKSSRRRKSKRKYEKYTEGTDKAFTKDGTSDQKSSRRRRSRRSYDVDTEETENGTAVAEEGTLDQKSSRRRSKAKYENDTEETEHLSDIKEAGTSDQRSSRKRRSKRKYEGDTEGIENVADTEGTEERPLDQRSSRKRRSKRKYEDDTEGIENVADTEGTEERPSDQRSSRKRRSKRSYDGNAEETDPPGVMRVTEEELSNPRSSRRKRKRRSYENETETNEDSKFDDEPHRRSLSKTIINEEDSITVFAPENNESEGRQSRSRKSKKHSKTDSDPEKNERSSKRKSK